MRNHANAKRMCLLPRTTRGTRTPFHTKAKEKNRQEKLESVLLRQLHFKLPAKFKYNDMTSRLAAWSLRTSFKMATVDVRFWVSLETDFLG